MDLIVDANIIIAALVKENINYGFLFLDCFHFFTTEYLFTEIEEHKEEILQKTQKSVEEFNRALEIFKRRIIIIPLEELLPHLSQAEEISPDPDDVAYFALALKLNCPIWSNDKDLKEKQDIVKIYSTNDLIALLEKEF